MMNMVLMGSLPTNLAAIGAAINPPTIKPATSNSGNSFKRIKNVMALAKTIKNSAKHTDPIT